MNASNTPLDPNALVVSVHLMHPQPYDQTFGSCTHYSLYVPQVQSSTYLELKQALGFDMQNTHPGYNMVNIERDQAKTAFEQAWFKQLDPCIDALMLWCVEQGAVQKSGALEALSVQSIALFGCVSSAIMNVEGELGAPYGDPVQQQAQKIYQHLLNLEYHSELPLEWYAKKGHMSAQSTQWLPPDEYLSYEQLKNTLLAKKGTDVDQVSHWYSHFEQAMVHPLLKTVQQHTTIDLNASQVQCLRSVGGRIYWGDTFCHPVQEDNAPARAFLAQQFSVWQAQTLAVHTHNPSKSTPRMKGL